MENQQEKTVVITQESQVNSVNGKITVINPDGTRHILQSGKHLDPGQKLIIPEDAKLDIQLDDGQSVPLELGRLNPQNFIARKWLDHHPHMR